MYVPCIRCSRISMDARKGASLGQQDVYKELETKLRK